MGSIDRISLLENPIYILIGYLTRKTYADGFAGDTAAVRTWTRWKKQQGSNNEALAFLGLEKRGQIQHKKHCFKNTTVYKTSVIVDTKCIKVFKTMVSKKTMDSLKTPKIRCWKM